jgi:thiol-disulfide isomerase/thioredoxin
MNKLLLLLSAALTFSWAAYTINYRPYISTRMAQILMSTDIPDDQVTKRCDGSGWITHGDGHKTECPGCSACEGNEPDPVDKEIMYRIYHFGAKWCPPCEKMKTETWKNDTVKAVINKRDGKLHLFDVDNADHDKFFDWYKVTSYPTIIIMSVDDLEHPIFRVSGYVGPGDMANTLEEKLAD